MSPGAGRSGAGDSASSARNKRSSPDRSRDRRSPASLDRVVSERADHLVVDTGPYMIDRLAVRSCRRADRSASRRAPSPGRCRFDCRTRRSVGKRIRTALGPDLRSGCWSSTIAVPIVINCIVTARPPTSTLKVVDTRSGRSDRPSTPSSRIVLAGSMYVSPSMVNCKWTVGVSASRGSPAPARPSPTASRSPSARRRPPQAASSARWRSTAASAAAARARANAGSIVVLLRQILASASAAPIGACIFARFADPVL